MTNANAPNEAAELIARIRATGLLIPLAIVLKEKEVAQALAQPNTHKQQPLARLLRAIDKSWEEHPRQVLANLKRRGGMAS